ncbi:hypothetical protein NEDG_01861 [Nematocida displodere]|uniref:Uncharacterized protein n=1 Tax=Nematocida displodere TaxID=1805483 RepID=A0A177EGK6_9MICR|nr:hypothetical protein NEDG_01861 [Nematocida displodere]
MKTGSLWYFGRVGRKLANGPILCLIALLLLVRSAVEALDTGDYVTSPYIGQTIEFFSASCYRQYTNTFESAQTATTTYFLKKQGTKMNIAIDKYTLASVPEKMAHEFEFSAIRIVSSNQAYGPNTVNLAVLEKILSAFGRLCTSVLELGRIIIKDSADMKSSTQDLAGGVQAVPHKDSTSGGEVARCVLEIKSLKLLGTTEAAIKWFSARVDLSLSQIDLEIRDRMKMDSLEVLDEFNASRIVRLSILQLMVLRSLECKWLREGPLPSVLVIETFYLLSPNISGQIAQNILGTPWEQLRLSKQMWGEIVKQNNKQQTIKVDSLVLHIPYFATSSEFQASLLPPMGETLASVTSLTINLHSGKKEVTPEVLTTTLESITRHFRDVVHISIAPGYKLSTVTKFIEETQFVIETNPGLASIKVNGIECVHRTEQSGPILCLSPEVWELYTQGKLGEELTRTGADLSQLAPEQEAMVMRLGGVDHTKSICAQSQYTFDDLKRSSALQPPKKIEIFILDRPEDQVSGGCVARVVVKNEPNPDLFVCPVCARKTKLPPVMNKIQKNDQGNFVLAAYTPPSAAAVVMVFPQAQSNPSLSTNL